MLEIGAIDFLTPPIYQIDTQRSGINPFAPVDDVATANTKETDEKAKTNNFTNANQLIEAFNLYDPESKQKLLSFIPAEEQKKLINLLNPQAMVLGMKLYDEEKILNLLFETSQKDISKVLKGTLPLQEIFQMIPEDTLNKFILSEDLQKGDFMEGFKLLSQGQLSKILGTIIGLPQDNKTIPEMLNTLKSLPIELLQPSLLATKTGQKINLISAMVTSNDELFKLFPKSQLLIPLDNIGKEDTLKGFDNLEPETIGGMLKQLPDELLPLLLTLVSTELLARIVLEKYPEAINKAVLAKAQAQG